MAIFTNQATLSYNGNTISSNIVTGEILGRITASKTAIGDDYTVGDPITYTVSVINTGDSVISEVTVTDDLGAYEFGQDTLVPLDYVAGSAVYFVNGVPQGAPTVQAGPPLVISGIDIPAGGNALVVYQATPNSFASGEADGSITNTATIDADGICTPVTASATVEAAEGADLTITKEVDPTPVVENGVVTYTLTVRNFGNTPIVATDSVIINDTFDPVLENITVALNGETLDASQYTYDEATGAFATADGTITVPAATFVRDENGAFSVVPGVSVLTVSGNIGCGDNG